jgi:hypothetical protein
MHAGPHLASRLGAPRYLGMEREASPSVAVPVAVGFVLGGILGAAAGLLLAPARGPLLPKRTWRRVDEAKDSLLEAVRASRRPPLRNRASAPA